MQGETDHLVGVYLLSPESLDGVDQRDDFPPRIFQCLQAIPCDDVDGASHVDKDSPHNSASHLHFYHQQIIMQGSEAWAFSSTEPHCGHCNSVNLLSHEDLLGTSKLSLLGRPSDAFCVSTGDSGHYIRGALLVSGLGPRGLALLSKEALAPLQKPVDLSLIRQFVKGIP